MQCTLCGSENTIIHIYDIEGNITHFCLDCNEFFTITENN